MMALNSGPSADTSTLPSRSMSSKGYPLRRRRSKGTIAGFAFGKATGDAPSALPNPPEVNGEVAGATEHTANTVVVPNNTTQGNQPQHTNDNPSAPSKPCHSARLALLCCQNAIRMGARTQLGLCPPGRARRGLQAALRQRTRSNRASMARKASLQGNVDAGGYYGLDKMVGAKSLDDYIAQEEDFLLSTNTFDVESDEEASSGDEDDLNNIDDLLEEDSPALDDEKKYVSLREPLFTPVGAESSLSNPNGGSMAAGANGGAGKLPFNRRKIRYFDAVSASDRGLARTYLQRELRKSKQRDALLLARHLRQIQRQERRQRKIDNGESLDEGDASDQENDDPKEKALLTGGVACFEEPMTPAASAALLAESLSLNPYESVEGMAKCYDGIVAAGVALLDLNVDDPTSPSSSDDDKPARSRSDIMAALTPLLITSLEQPAGEVILSLARLRRMCGTTRYQRRFVQRVAPSLIRPPHGAMWCLRHQNEMEPILAAAELIFDCASEIFSKGWYERGQLLLADTKRAETLNTAAMQLRNLSAETEGSLTLGFTGHGHGHGMWRSSKYKSTSTSSKDAAKASGGNLAEWEVIAVDRQIRISISNIIKTDWSRVVVHTRDSDLSRSYHRNKSTTSISKRPSVLPQPTSGDMSPKSIIASPASPARPTGMKNPVSPPGANVYGSNAPPPPSSSSSSLHGDNGESSFPVSFSDTNTERSSSPFGGPSAPQQTPKSPTPPQRSGPDEIDPSQGGASGLFPSVGQTPPRSPKSPKKESIGEITNLVPPAPSQSASPLSPKRRTPSTTQMKESITSQNMTVQASPNQAQFSTDKERAPLSPSSVGTSASTPDMVPYRPVSSASSVASSVSAGSQPAHYRMLTSTAAERKRTVAACRALRSQISRFEDAFIQLHGRPPKGAAERAPLATTYAQYREWKRAIRADAACRIQANWRGAFYRRKLLRSNNPRISHVVMTGAGRSSFISNNTDRQSGGQDSVLKQLSIPSEIGEAEQDRSPGIQSVSNSKSFNDVNSDNFVAQGQGGTQALPPQWGNQIVRRRGSGERPPHDGFSGSPVPKPFPSPSGSVSSVNSVGDLSHFSLQDLQSRKRELKQQLKHYDMNFARKHGRMPVKAEKEPIRHLYESYNALKSEITRLEQESRQTASPVMQQPAPILPQRTVSPPSGPDSGEDSPVGMRGKRKQQPKAPSFDQMSASVGSPAANAAAAAASPSGDMTSALSALKAEKGKLHQMLRSYEKDFFKEHKRQVSSFADIKPVASQYRRYKEIKKAIAFLQNGEK